MAHSSIEDLQLSIQDASTHIDVGGQYVHYKHADAIYFITGFAILEATEEACVLYQSKDTGVTFIRPVSSWLEDVQHEGVSVPRFKKYIEA